MAGAFKRLQGKLENKGYGAAYAAAIAAKAGRAKLGEAEMERRSLAGKRRAEGK